MQDVLRDLADFISLLIDQSDREHRHLYHAMVDSLDSLSWLHFHRCSEPGEQQLFNHHRGLLASMLNGIAAGPLIARQHNPEACRVVEALGLQKRCVDLVRSLRLLRFSAEPRTRSTGETIADLGIDIGEDWPRESASFMQEVLHDVVELISDIVGHIPKMHCHLYYPVLDSLEFLVELRAREEWRGIEFLLFDRNLEVVSGFLTGVSAGTPRAHRRHPEACRVVKELGVQARCAELSRAIRIIKGESVAMRACGDCP